MTGATNVNATGNAVDNILTGNTGNNTLNGGLGADTLRGGVGNDSYIVENVGDAITENAGQGTDTARSSITDVLAANAENLTLTGTAAINATGNALDNVLTGNAAVNQLTGGTGDDTYVIGSIDTVVENVGAGIDEIQIGSTEVLGANLENLTLTGTVAIDGTGNTVNNNLTGNVAANTLTGAAGNDTLDGAAGNDLLQGGVGSDTYQFTTGWGADTVAENDATAGNTDQLAFGSDIGSDDLVFERSGNNLEISRVGTTDVVNLRDWYVSATNQTEQIGVSDGSMLVNTQVDQLIQAMATFTADTGLSWEQGLNQRPEEVQAVLAGVWQPSAAAKCEPLSPGWRYGHPGCAPQSFISSSFFTLSRPA